MAVCQLPSGAVVTEAYVTSVSWVDPYKKVSIFQGRSVIGLHCTKGILYPHCTKRMTQGSAPISAQAPREYRLFSQVNGPKLVTVMGVPPCKTVSERYERPDPLVPWPLPPFFGHIARRNDLYPSYPHLCPWAEDLGLSGSPRKGRGRVLGPWPLASVSNRIALDLKETSPCSLSTAWTLAPH